MLDSEGVDLGEVFDLEATRDGPRVSDAWGDGLVVRALLVGPRAFLLRLGYGKRDIRGPLGLRLAGRKAKGYKVPWAQVEQRDAGHIFLKCRRADLQQIED